MASEQSSQHTDQEGYVDVSNLAFNSGMAVTAAALVLAFVSAFTGFDFEFVAIMVAFVGVILFLLANYAVIVATRGEAA